MAASRVWSGSSPRAKEFILIFNRKSWFCTRVELEESCGFHREQLLWFSFLYSYHLVYGRKKTCFSSQSDNYFVPSNHFPGVSDENKPSLCTLVLWCQLGFVSFPLVRAEVTPQLWWPSWEPPRACPCCMESLVMVRSHPAESSSSSSKALDPQSA